MSSLSINDISDEIKSSLQSKHTNVWLYNVSKQCWDHLHDELEKKKYCMSSYLRVAIAKNDVIVIYQKDKRRGACCETGFVGIVVAKCDIYFNQTLKIFKDNNLNKYVVNLTNLILFASPIKFADIGNKLKDCSSFKSELNFKTTHVIGSANFVQIKKIIGSIIVTALLDKYCDRYIDDIDDIDDIGDNDDASSVSSDSDSNSSESSESSISSVHTKSSIQSQSSVQSKSTNISHSSETSKSSKSTNQSSVSNSDVKKDNSNGVIPIIVVPCKKFIISSNNKQMIEEFKKHFMSCVDCEICDNNEHNNIFKLYAELQKSNNIKFSMSEEHDDYYDIIDCYLNVSKYELPDDEDDDDYEKINVILINDKAHSHHNCLLVVWQI